jgi:cation/acetate symporter
VLWAIGIIGTFYLFTLAPRLRRGGPGGRQGDHRAGQGGQHARPQLAQALGIEYLGGRPGGAVLLAIIAAVAFATILAVVAGLTLASSSSVAHDFYASVIKRARRRAGRGAGRPDLRPGHRRVAIACRSSRRA